MLKLGRSRANAEQAKIAEILTEFSELHSKVKAVSNSVLMPATKSSDAKESDTSKHIMVIHSDIRGYTFIVKICSQMLFCGLF